MKVLTGACSCGMKNCSTVFEIKQDPEKDKNILFVIKDDTHELETWVSLDKDTYTQIVKFLRSKYGRIE